MWIYYYYLINLFIFLLIQLNIFNLNSYPKVIVFTRKPCIQDASLEYNVVIVIGIQSQSAPDKSIDKSFKIAQLYIEEMNDCSCWHMKAMDPNQ